MALFADAEHFKSFLSRAAVSRRATAELLRNVVFAASIYRLL